MVLDILIVGYLIYFVYKRLKGSVGFNIFIGVLLLALMYTVVRYLKMNLLSTLLGSFFQIGAVIFVIVFQPEVRRFLLMIGENTQQRRVQFLDKFFGKEISAVDEKISSIAQNIADAMVNLSRQKEGALIVIIPELIEDTISGSGVTVDAKVSEMLIENIFQKNAPLHDGAMIITGDRIHSASVILPVSNSTEIDQSLGLRHRAALGISEATTAAAYIVSEETGKISYAHKGRLYVDINPKDLVVLLKTHLTQSN